MIDRRVTRFEARANITLNGRRRYISGAGTVDSRKGIVKGTYSHDIPIDEVDPKVFQAVLITGYPSVSKNQTGHPNPFEVADYTYTRNVDLGSHGHIRYDARVWAEASETGGVLRSEFEVSCMLNTPELGCAGNVFETWLDKGSEIASRFDIRWDALDGESAVIGQAATCYRPGGKAPHLPSWQREIFFPMVFADHSQLLVCQRSVLME